ncbi:MAG: hypothetical protein PVI88_07635 [Nitrosopumilaceae archaeon]|jgi:hypothetical protein
MIFKNTCNIVLPGIVISTILKIGEKLSYQNDISKITTSLPKNLRLLMVK